MAHLQGEWSNYLLPRHHCIDFPPRALVLDVGCGNGEILLELRKRHCAVLGLDADHGAVVTCRNLGLRVLHGRGEELPLKTACLDGVVCRVVIPYTDEVLTLREIARVLKTGGVAYLSYHGSGYYLRYLLFGQSWKQRVYGLRALVNTWFYVITGRRLHGFWGDTIYQSRRRLARYYKSGGVLLLEEETGKRYWGLPVFIYHTGQKVASISSLEP